MCTCRRKYLILWGNILSFCVSQGRYSTTGGQGGDFSVYTDRALNKFDSNCKGGIFLFQFPRNSSDNLKKEREKKRKSQICAKIP